jgi:ribosomal peptide maturation radical SAM protein 1
VTGQPTIERPAAPDICLVSMPYVSVTMPSMALGLLKGILAAQDIDARVVQANLWFAEAVGLRRYQLFIGQIPMVFYAGEWTFAGAAFPDDPRRDEKDAEFISQIHRVYELEEPKADRNPAARRGRADAMVADLWAMRSAATQFVDDAARRILATGARVVGCTSTFEQHVASLALLRRISELDPDVITMLGGANCETDMGETTHRCFPWVDYVVSGEADGIVADLCRLALTRGRDVAVSDLPPSVLTPARRKARRQAGPARRTSSIPRSLYRDLDSLPTPRFDDYFDTLAGLSLKDQVRPGLPIETSRGCWWGAVHHCTFCGLNGTGMGFRSKSAERVFAEIHELEERYHVNDFEAVDNILDMGYLKSLLPMLAAEGSDRRIFFEIKANTTRERLEEMVRGGITWVQPGIENLHTEVLRLMDKGVQGWQNVQLLKWSRELGLRLTWAVLAGFPGEKDEWYQDMATWMPLLEHLQPPSGTTLIRYDRFSVYFGQAQQYGLVLFPIGAMSFVYPVGPADLDGLAYFFATEPGVGPARHMTSKTEALGRAPGIQAVFNAARDWRAAHIGRTPMLLAEDQGAVLQITDTRSCARSPRHALTGLARLVCLACGAAPRESKLAEALRRDYQVTASEEEIAEVLARLEADRLVLRMDGRLMGLPLNAPLPALAGDFDFPGGAVYLEGARPEAEPREPVG